MNRNTPKERKIDMYKAILELKNLEECIEFFEDICAMTELHSMEQRFEVARMLKHNKVYTEIKEKTNASSATISRVNRMLNYGTGRLGEILERMEEQEENISQAAQTESVDDTSTEL
ncbi:MAG: YerC/YecD family TrpR-related protein [Lachnospiraceae bacterium]